MPNGDHSYQYGKFEGEVLERLDSIKTQLDGKVDRVEFLPVKSIAYGMVGLILTAVVGALIAGVVKAAALLTPLQ